MKHIGSLLVFIAAAALITFGLNGNALAFHEGGVAHCDGCHTMHNSVDGQPDLAGSNTTGPGTSLTKGSDPSSTCLNCHQDSATSTSSYHAMSLDGSIYHAGGDFFWIDTTYGWTITRGTTVINRSSPAEDHGHSIVALDFGLTAQANPDHAPGGTYLAADLGCSSCHDPHGTVTSRNGGPISVSGSYGDPAPAGTIAGNYRLLADNGYTTKGLQFNTPGGPPVAISTNSRTNTDTNHADYGSNMSEWCANCHGEFAMAQKHPVGPVNGDLSKNNATLGQSYAETYNKYVKTGDMSGAGFPASTGPFLELVPFERGAGATLATDNVAGPASGNVMCLTCHRAHASAFPYGGRWDFTTEFVVDSHPQQGDSGLDNLFDPDAQKVAYYGRDMATDYGEYQRSLCNKCHGKD